MVAPIRNGGGGGGNEPRASGANSHGERVAHVEALELCALLQPCGNGDERLVAHRDLELLAHRRQRAVLARVSAAHVL